MCPVSRFAGVIFVLWFMGKCFLGPMVFLGAVPPVATGKFSMLPCRESGIQFLLYIHGFSQLLDRRWSCPKMNAFLISWALDLMVGFLITISYLQPSAIKEPFLLLEEN